MKILLSVENLNKNFGNIQAVENLSFNVFEDDIYGFLGQNGAGKSTTMRMLLNLIKPTSGRITIFGKDSATHREDILKNTGALIERPDLYKYLSAIDHLKIFAKLSNLSPSKTELLKHLALVGLESRANDKVGGFSQGMKQRLGIAIALIHNPGLLILDEPTNGLDPQGIVDIRNLIRMLAIEQHKTIIVSSHLLNEIEQIATRILIINKGKKVAEGSTSEFVNPDKTILRVRTFQAEKAIKLSEVSHWKAIATADSEVFEVTLNMKDIPAFNRMMVANDIDIYAIQQLNNLEKNFIELTAK